MHSPIKSTRLADLPDPFYTKKHYNLLVDIVYVDRYGHVTCVKAGKESDGSTGAFDIKSMSWWCHDQWCEQGGWDDGTPMTNWQASTMLGDILWSEGRWFRSVYWKWFTFLLGCEKAKLNGMFRIKRGQI